MVLAAEKGRLIAGRRPDLICDRSVGASVHLCSAGITTIAVVLWQRAQIRNALSLAAACPHLGQIHAVGSGGRGPLPIPSLHTTGHAGRQTAVHEAHASRRYSAKRLTRPMFERAAFEREACMVGCVAVRHGPCLP